VPDLQLFTARTGAAAVFVQQSDGACPAAMGWVTSVSLIPSAWWPPALSLGSGAIRGLGPPQQFYFQICNLSRSTTSSTWKRRSSGCRKRCRTIVLHGSGPTDKIILLGSGKKQQREHTSKASFPTSNSVIVKPIRWWYARTGSISIPSVARSVRAPGCARSAQAYAWRQTIFEISALPLSTSQFFKTSLRTGTSRLSPTRSSTKLSTAPYLSQ